VNLASDPAYQAQITELSAMVDTWMKEQGDTVRMKRDPFPLSGPTPHELKAKDTK
jgi:hypothetical protein